VTKATIEFILLRNSSFFLLLANMNMEGEVILIINMLLKSHTGKLNVQGEFGCGSFKDMQD
jgi:hypothetical protein